METVESQVAQRESPVLGRGWRASFEDHSGARPVKKALPS